MLLGSTKERAIERLATTVLLLYVYNTLSRLLFFSSTPYYRGKWSWDVCERESEQRTDKRRRRMHLQKSTADEEEKAHVSPRACACVCVRFSGGPLFRKQPYTASPEKRASSPGGGGRRLEKKAHQPVALKRRKMGPLPSWSWGDDKFAEKKSLWKPRRKSKRAPQSPLCTHTACG